MSRTRSEGSDASAVLSRIGGVATAARRAIVEAMLGAGRLQTAEEIRSAAGRGSRGVGLATVYRTLERLDGAGALKRATLSSGQIGYAYCPPEHHEHAICISCGRLRALRPCLVATPHLPDGFTASGHTLDFLGLCARCRTAVRAEA